MDDVSPFGVGGVIAIGAMMLRRIVLDINMENLIVDPLNVSFNPGAEVQLAARFLCCGCQFFDAPCKDLVSTHGPRSQAKARASMQTFVDSIVGSASVLVEAAPFVDRGRSRCPHIYGGRGRLRSEQMPAGHSDIHHLGHRQRPPFLLVLLSVSRAELYRTGRQVRVPGGQFSEPSNTPSVAVASTNAFFGRPECSLLPHLEMVAAGKVSFHETTSRLSFSAARSAAGFSEEHPAVPQDTDILHIKIPETYEHL